MGKYLNTTFKYWFIDFIIIFNINYHSFNLSQESILLSSRGLSLFTTLIGRLCQVWTVPDFWTGGAGSSKEVGILYRSKSQGCCGSSCFRICLRSRGSPSLGRICSFSGRLFQLAILSRFFILSPTEPGMKRWLCWCRTSGWSYRDADTKYCWWCSSNWSLFSWVDLCFDKALQDTLFFDEGMSKL